MGMLVSVLILGLLILVHETGHFVVARWAGVKILRFSIGFGPRLFGWTRGDTEYTISAIPLGGYVKMAGEQHGEQVHQPYEYLSKPVGVRAGIVFAGPFVNYLVAVLTLWMVYLIGFQELSPTVGKLIEDMPAVSAGLREADRIVSIDEEPVATWEEMTVIIHRSADIPLQFEIDREGATQVLTITPALNTDSKDLYGRLQSIGQIGIMPGGDLTITRLGPIEAIGRTMSKHAEWCVMMGEGIWSIFAGRRSIKEMFTGPIGIIMLTSQAVHLGITTLLYLVSLFSLSLAVFNVLPIPILDGGHLFFMFLEKLRGGHPVSVNIQERAAQVSLVLLVTLIVVVCVNDIQRFHLVEKILDLVR